MSIRLKMALRLFLTLVLSLFILNLSRNLWRLWRAGERIKEAEKMLEEVKAESAGLRQEKQKLESGRFLEEQARNKLFMAKKNEVVLLLPAGEATKTAFQEETLVEDEEKEIWQKWLDLFW